jgi:2-polyprenyl-3-methyl-5-hydroxy-6-metoxy-1,4-benzoquinol methylase
VGHTGWSDPVIYSYDQIERLALIEKTVGALAVDPLYALDFGCGTGEFSQMLLKKDMKVYGYDPYVKPKITESRFDYIGQHSEINRTVCEPLGLILSVTVLDHILNESELLDELKYLRTMIASTGSFLLLEYALDEDTGKPKSSYQAFRTMNQWRNYFARSRWAIAAVIPVAHPVLAPSRGFNNFERNAFISAIRGIAQRRYFKKLLLPVLRIRARTVFCRYGLEEVVSSPLKLILCRPDVEEIR